MLLFLAMNAMAHPIDTLGWLSGCWTTATGTEECWLPPRGQLMVGVNRAVRDGRAPFYEYLRIESIEGTLAYVASPKGQTTTRFDLVEQGEHFVVFANPTHDFPQRIRYQRDGDTLTATISGKRDGQLAESSWTFRRTPL